MSDVKSDEVDSVESTVVKNELVTEAENAPENYIETNTLIEKSSSRKPTADLMDSEARNDTDEVIDKPSRVTKQEEGDTESNTTETHGHSNGNNESQDIIDKGPKVEEVYVTAVIEKSSNKLLSDQKIKSV